ncbi:uncharacterized protein TRUGW13939_02444 [Talaromyces rugulosus]|uniref:Alcohol dehydrogenase-like C-terminal domain-containing protein n=1 Tax=Talaromyces rugulosus TaxID=121627 RepID=A0A7H8QNB3_TALRU|nr:uncharacterized protein TRUGW13939_02444 [Talaromyces rugulosus]QKX55352.1 hypothetical protein TRUGW13939_02444 [Talaromyces rugulosus]
MFPVSNVAIRVSVDGVCTGIETPCRAQASTRARRASCQDSRRRLESSTVVEAGPDCSITASALVNKLLILTPILRWDADPDGPEDMDKYAIIGASNRYPHGTAQDYIAVRKSEVELCPSHLSPAEGATLALCGLTGWRALVTKSGNAKPVRNILVTGIGGGAAVQVLLIGVAIGGNIYITSGDEAKIDKAVRLGAKGGVKHKAEAGEKQFQKMLPADRPYLDAAIDGAGGDIVARESNTPFKAR